MSTLALPPEIGQRRELGIRKPALYERTYCQYCQVEGRRVSGRRLRWERESRSLTRRELSDAIGIDGSLIAKIESGKRRAPESLTRFFDLIVDAGTTSRPHE